MKMFSLVCLMLLCHSIFVVSCDDNASQPKSIFILAGQSNMVGRGGFVNNKLVVPPECQPNPQILRLNPELAWEEAKEALHAGIDLKQCGIGPGMIFANSVLQRDPNIGVIGLVPCAVGATSISRWLPGNDLYVKMLSRTQAALNNGGGEIKALLWYQGENDMVDEASANAYKCNLERLITQLRSDLQLPNLPVIEVALASRGKRGKNLVYGEYFDVVRSAQLEMPNILPNVKCVDALGFEVSNYDNLHLTAPAEIKLGKMLAAAFLS